MSGRDRDLQRCAWPRCCAPRSCGNRHCPDCQGQQALAWLSRQEALLLPVPYFHVVFTLPHELNPIVPQNQRSLYTLRLGSVAQTLLSFGRQNLKAELGLTLVLHTWSQTLLDHYHDARRICPRCGRRALVWVETVYGPARGPPTPDLFAA